MIGCIEWPWPLGNLPCIVDVTGLIWEESTHKHYCSLAREIQNLLGGEDTIALDRQGWSSVDFLFPSPPDVPERQSPDLAVLQGYYFQRLDEANSIRQGEAIEGWVPIEGSLDIESDLVPRPRYCNIV